MPDVIKLRLVGASADLANLIYTSAKKGRRGSHMAAIDDKLYDVLEDVYLKKKRQQKAQAEVKKATEPRVESKIAPRDIQKMLRAGRTPDAIAKLAGVPVTFVQRFSGPVRDEQLGIIQEFQTLRFTKQRLGESAAPVGDAVARNLRARHVDLDADELADSWTATRTDGNPWTVALRFRARGREMRAAWKFDPSSRTITAANPLAADLAYVSRASRAPAPARAAAKPGTKAPSKSSGGPKAKKAARKKSAARPKPKPKKAARKKSAARPRPKKVVRKRPASRRPARKRTAAKRKVARSKTRPAPRRKSAARAKPKRRTTRPAARRPVKKAAKKKRTSRARTSRTGARRR